MPTNQERKDAIRRWQDHCDNIQRMTIAEQCSEAERQKRIDTVRRNYAKFVAYYFPHYCTDKDTGRNIPAAKFHIQAAELIRKQRDLRAVFQWARGHAKSTHMDIMIPLWLLCQKEPDIHVMVLVGKSESNARTLLGDLQAELQFNQRYIADFGPQYNAGNWQDGQFVTQSGVAFFALGRGQSPRGLRYRESRPDYIVIDDLDDDELCRNEHRVHQITAWVKEALFGTLGAQGGRFVMVGNLIARVSVLSQISASNSVITSRVNVYDAKGKPSWPEFWTPERIRAKEQFQGYRAFQKEYMNNPMAGSEGAVFRNDWIKWKKLPPLRSYDQLVCYTDPSFKATTRNNYKASKLWGKLPNGELHLIAAFCRQTTVAEMVRWLYDLHQRIADANAAAMFYMEANFMQDIILDEFYREGQARGYQLPITPDRRKKPDKFQRIEAISPLWERGFVYYNEDQRADPDYTAALEQTLAFERGMTSHDDGPDADEGAIYILQRTARSESFEPIVRRYSNHRHTW